MRRYEDVVNNVKLKVSWFGLLAKFFTPYQSVCSRQTSSSVSPTGAFFFGALAHPPVRSTSPLSPFDDVIIVKVKAPIQTSTVSEPHGRKKDAVDALRSRGKHISPNSLEQKKITNPG